MPGLVPGIHVLIAGQIKDVDGRDKPGHDVEIGRSQRRLVLVERGQRAAHPCQKDDAMPIDSANSEHAKNSASLADHRSCFAVDPKAFSLREPASSSLENVIERGLMNSENNQNATPMRIPRRQTTRARFFTLPWRSSNRSGTDTIGNISRQAPPAE
jgi:hypothetical protein